MKGIILAGGKGTRLYPSTLACCKQLLPVYDKPMVYYPLSVLMLSKIREVLIITTPEDQMAFQRLLRDGSQWGMHFEYIIQDSPRGIPDAFRLGRNFIQNDPVCLILGDNIFFGGGFVEALERVALLETGATVFAYAVHDPQRYGVIEFDENRRALSIEEKPKNPRSNFAITGLYFCDNQVCALAEDLRASARGETEITDIQRAYMQRGQLHVELLGRGVAWLDAGTPESLLQAASFVQAIEHRQGLMIASPEEIAYRKGFISARQLHQLAALMGDNHYSQYLLRLLKEEG